MIKLRHLILYVILVGGALFVASRTGPDYTPLDEYVYSHVPKLLTQLPKIEFVEITDDAGISFVHDTGHYGELLFPEVNGPGCGFFDFDNDGDQDILLVNSGKWPHQVPGKVSTVIHSLYLNDGSGHFKDVGEEMGLSSRSYGHGVCFGDVNNDGYTDIYITCVGRNLLFINQGAKRFVDVAEQAGVLCDAYSTAAAFLDYDKDGLVDLFVCNYVEWSVEIERAVHEKHRKKLEDSGKDLEAFLSKGEPEDKKKRIQALLESNQLDYADSYANTPGLFKRAHCRLFRNLDGNRFKDVSNESGVIGPSGESTPLARGMAVAVFDCNDDGWPDISVANDESPDFLLINQSDGTFKDRAEEYGTSLGNNGNPRAGMGMDWAYYANDTRLAMVVSNYAGQNIGFYLKPNSDSDVYIDSATMMGVASPTQSSVMWGVFFFDMDLDGLQDIFVANGHVSQGRARYSNHEYEQSPVLLWNTGDHPDYVQLDSSHVGEGLFTRMVARGAAYADIDSDGDLDILVATNGGRAHLFRNDLKIRKYVRLKLVGTKSNRSALGARVTLYAGEYKQIREVSSGGSYSSQSELVVTFGLRAFPLVDKIVIRWPSGAIQEITSIAINSTHTIYEKE